MLFPKIEELATTNVKIFSKTATLDEVVLEMIQSKHRHILVYKDQKYYDLNIHNILSNGLEYKVKEKKLDSFNLVELPTISKSLDLRETLRFLQNGVELIVVLNDDQKFYGILTRTDIISSIDPSILIDNIKLKDFLVDDRRSPWIHSKATTKDVIDSIGRYKYNAVIVVENKKAIGIFTTKDILKLLKTDCDLYLPISEYMVSPVETLPEDTSIKQALVFMKNKNYKQIITVDKNGNITGDITQKKLITMTYTKWVELVKKYQIELTKINTTLEQKSKNLEKIAGTDYLTGLYNRMKFMELYVSQYKLSREKGDKLSLLMVDIDHFKKINDTYGHNIGDKVLKQVSNILLQTLRHTDILSRWGGEEFLALLPTVDSKQAVKIAEQIRSNIKNFKLKNFPNVTVSIGVAEIKENEEFERLLNRVDKALYNAKNNGRDRVVVQN